jgi:hypothetical protein
LIINQLIKIKLRQFYLIITYIIVGLGACTPTNFEPDDAVLGYDFFPLEVGSFVEYAVEEQNYSSQNGGVPSIQNYQIREEIPQIFIDVEGERAFRIDQFRRNNANFAWQLEAVWVAKRTPSYAITVEDNKSFVKLGFPIKNGLRWNGNAFNNLGDDRYEITDLGKSLKINNLDFENTLKVAQADDSSRVSLDRRTEVYAQGIGLISKEYTQVFYCQPDPSDPAACQTISIDFGRVLKQKIINYGKK